MPTNQAFASVNVHECSWADAEFELSVPGGAKLSIVDFEAAKWARKLERAITKGSSGGRPMKRTRGDASYEASVTASRGGWAIIISALEVYALTIPSRVRGDRVVIGGIEFDLLIQHTPQGSPHIYQAKLTGCSYDGDSSDMKQGNEADMIELTVNPIEIATKLSTENNWKVIA